ncbi:MAG: hypothetical protein ACSLE8_23675, partial [Rhodococcus sp. (in: high G+C Gram-positive bacteria)]
MEPSAPDEISPLTADGTETPNMTAPESTQDLSPHASDHESAIPDEAAPARGARRLRRRWL